MESSRRRKDERATNDAGLLTTFRELERALAVAVRECARAVETNARRRDAQGEESLRTANEETTRWRAWCARARMQTTRCAEALARRARRDEARRLLRRWREAVHVGREERARAREARLRTKRSVLDAWRALRRASRVKVSKREETLTRETTFYRERCDDAVAKLAPRKRHPAAVCANASGDRNDSESEVRRAFIRGVCALNLEAARVL